MPTQTSTMVGVVQAIKFLQLFGVNLSSRLLAGGFELRRIFISGSIPAQFEPFHASNSKGKRFPGSLGQQIANRALLDFPVVKPDDYSAIKEWNVAELQRERIRLCYVAATRARDLLILPRHSCALKDGCLPFV